MSLVRCMEVVWHGPGRFSHTGTPTGDWQRVLDRAAAIRLLEDVPFGRDATIYEVDLVDHTCDMSAAPCHRTVQFLVVEDVARRPKLFPERR